MSRPKLPNPMHRCDYPPCGTEFQPNRLQRSRYRLGYTQHMFCSPHCGNRADSLWKRQGHRVCHAKAAPESPPPPVPLTVVQQIMLTVWQALPLYPGHAEDYANSLHRARQRLAG